jgi:hypothetical protein
VIYGKMVVEGALKLLGVGVGEVKRGESATSGSGTRPFSAQEAEHARQLGQVCAVPHLLRSSLAITTVRLRRRRRRRLCRGGCEGRE